MTRRRHNATPTAAIFAVLAVSSIEAQQPQLSSVLERAAAYVLDFEQQLSGIVAEEAYVQEVFRRPRRRGTPGRTRVQRRELKSDLLIVRVEGADRWIQFRDVFEVDGKPVRYREERLTALFLEPSASTAARVGQIRRESARYNIGSIERTMNVPVLPLSVLDPEAQPRFVFSRGDVITKEITEGETLPSSPHFKVTTELWIVRFEEKRGPTLVRTPQGGDIFSRGRLWIEPATGRVLMSEMITENAKVRAQINVSYQSEPLLGMLVPMEMRETYTAGLVGSIIEGTATYGRFRQFQVHVGERIEPIQR
jgi:hypothetical protein